MQAENPAAGECANRAGVKGRDKQAGFTRTGYPCGGAFAFLPKAMSVWISVRVQLEGPDRDGRDSRGWHRQGRNAALRPEQGRE